MPLINYRETNPFGLLDMASIDNGTGVGSDENSGETHVQTPANFFPLYCLTQLSEQEKASYQKALDSPYNDVKFIDWSHDKEGGMDDMYLGREQIQRELRQSPLFVLLRPLRD